MSRFTEIISSKEKIFYIKSSGVATMADFAMSAAMANQVSVMVCLEKKELQAAKGLARIFNPSLSSEPWPMNRPVWHSPLLVFPDYRNWNHPQTWLNRLPLLYALSLGKPVCIITDMENLILRYIPRDFFEKRTLELLTGQDFAPELILDQAIEWGYKRMPMVSAPGEIARRGDIVDIFVPGYPKPARLEFFGDNLEELRVFDAESQRSLLPLEVLEIIPACPIIQDGKMLEKIKNHIKNLEESEKLSDNDAYSLRKKLEEDPEGILPGIVYNNASRFEDWCGDNCFWLLPGELEVINKLGEIRDKMKEESENSENGLRQPGRLVLRKKSDPAPWNGHKCVFFEPQLFGREVKGEKFPEKDFSSFQELFPLPEDRDRPWQTLVNGIKKLRSRLRQIIFSFSSPRGRQKFLSLANQDGLDPLLRYAADQEGLFAVLSSYKQGTELEWSKILILGEDILFPRAEKAVRKASGAFHGLEKFDDIKPGDLLVHRDYGIGRFGGLLHLTVNSVANDFLLLEYAGKDKLYLPADKLGLIKKYKGVEGFEPGLDCLGSQTWIQGREKTRKAIEKIAADLIEMYAYRKVAKSFHYDPPDDLYREFESTFGFEETPDQAKAIMDVLADMEKDAPMDRLICGDVGFGKTEVAMRAAFRAAEQGRQVVLLCPTTVLAEQHYQTFRSRLAGFPVNVGLLSRFVPRTKQKEILEQANSGKLDILIGTHRVLSSDVKLPKLGLLILDEEQRFGVRHKEKLKALKKNVDVLTLTATPIPRTLQLSIAGIRDLSIIETAPVDRKPVASAVIQKDDQALRQILQREIDRKGQIFWVYNRVHDLERVAEYVKKLVPEARIGLAHGQMGESELESTMRKFWHGEIDVLVCTSIVESGLDFPRANTLIVDQAQMFGLGQLYQLRGRVGRSDRQAFAYFVVPDAKRLSETAEERLKVILEMDYLGAGFQLAMEDLRIRGAGNILGEAQSGHITRIGLDLYLEMLEDAVGRLKGLPPQNNNETEINLGIPAHIPETYMDDDRERISYYKTLTSASSATAREEISLDIRDRYGAFPPELRNFIAMLDFKDFISSLEVIRADLHSNSIKLIWNEDQISIDPVKITQLASEDERIKIFPPATLVFNFDNSLTVPETLKSVESLLKKVLLKKEN